MTDADILLRQLQALANPVRLWVVSKLARDGPLYVSQLARAAGISRPLMKMHLNKLEGAALVESRTGAAETGKLANFYSVAPFDLHLTPNSIANAGPPPGAADPKSEGDRNG